LTFKIENWRNGYFCPKKVRNNFAIYVSFVFELVTRTYETDERTRHVVLPIRTFT